MIKSFSISHNFLWKANIGLTQTINTAHKTFLSPPQPTTIVQTSPLQVTRWWKWVGQQQLLTIWHSTNESSQSHQVMKVKIEKKKMFFHKTRNTKLSQNNYQKNKKYKNKKYQNHQKWWKPPTAIVQSHMPISALVQKSLKDFAKNYWSYDWYVHSHTIFVFQ